MLISTEQHIWPDASDRRVVLTCGLDARSTVSTYRVTSGTWMLIMLVAMQQIPPIVALLLDRILPGVVNRYAHTDQGSDDRGSVR